MVIPHFPSARVFYFPLKLSADSRQRSRLNNTDLWFDAAVWKYLCCPCFSSLLFLGLLMGRNMTVINSKHPCIRTKFCLLPSLVCGADKELRTFHLTYTPGSQKSPFSYFTEVHDASRWSGRKQCCGLALWISCRCKLHLINAVVQSLGCSAPL